MKVCLIYDFLTEYGGLERLMANHARMLKEEGFEVEILTCHYDQDVLNKMGFRSLPIRNISRIKTNIESISLSLSYIGLNLLSNINPDVFLSYSAPSNFLIRNKKSIKVNYLNHFPHFLYFNKNDKIQWASSTHGIKRWVSLFLSFFFGEKLKELDKKLVKMNKLNFVNSKFTKKGLDKLYKTNMILSYPMLDPIFKPSKKKINEKFIFSSSRIIPGKRYEWLIEACSYMKKKLPLYISGQYNKSYKEALERLAKKRKVQIKFLGRLISEDLITYYSSAVAVGFPTPNFEFGLVPAEGLACGTPIVVWGDGGGQSEQVIDGVNGYAAKPHDRRDYAKKLDLLADGKFKEKNRKQIIASSKKFSYEEIKKDFIKEFKQVIDLNNTRA